METQKTQKFVDANEVVELLKEIDGLKQKIDKLEIEKAELVVAKGKLTYRAETAEGELWSTCLRPRWFHKFLRR
ncbi:hypothetical protein KBA63_04145 [Candidatus Woesebacteria bacterium]|nr:hypothetical protein [Candidatus Woesebacteria bacterium]